MTKTVGLSTNLRRRHLKSAPRIIALEQAG